MTVKELVESAPNCDALEIVVREKGCGKWIQGYRISKFAEQWKSEHTVELQEKLDASGIKYNKVIKEYGDKSPRLKEGEIRDVMHGYNLPMKIIKRDVSHLPENVAGLQVCSFQPRHIPSFHREQMTHNEFSLDINCYPEGFVPELEEKKKDLNEQLEGQTDIFDFIGE